MGAKRLRLLIAIVIGAASGTICSYVLTRFGIGAGDFRWAIEAARDLLARRNPYAHPDQLYPLPAALFGLPFVQVKPEIAAGIFYGISTGLLAYGVTRDGYHYLLIFLAYPYWAGVLTAQWIVLITASAFYWWLSPVTMAKPQIGWPVALTRFRWKSYALCAAVVALTFLVMPNWIRLWVAQLGRYDHFIPVLVLPGPLLALALWRFRDPEAWLLFLAACTPQRWFYDSFFLWLIPKSRRQIVFTAGLSWIPGIWRWFHAPHSFTQVGRWTVLWIYLPMTAVLLLRRQSSGEIDAAR